MDIVIRLRRKSQLHKLEIGVRDCRMRNNLREKNQQKILWYSSKDDPRKSW